jgi:hypothetical protein
MRRWPIKRPRSYGNSNLNAIRNIAKHADTRARQGECKIGATRFLEWKAWRVGSLEASRQSVRPNPQQRKSDSRTRKQPTGQPEHQSGGSPLPSCSAHYRERRAGSCGNSHEMPASPSDRTGSSSCGSRRAPGRSLPHWEPYTPLSGLRMTLATGPVQRIGEEHALPR